jgi:hypothetical protein
MGQGVFFRTTTACNFRNCDQHPSLGATRVPNEYDDVPLTNPYVRIGMDVHDDTKSGFVFLLVIVFRKIQNNS